ncbi:CAP-Gly domain-containing linker protein 1-like [Macrobrachium nipponense]|uniref:CAP-Gly domain-containing linker protein 1-like n=1 Tax=Macrobrachium nipponense TaxID=159736 RepID=UPI0030C8261E
MASDSSACLDEAGNQQDEIDRSDIEDDHISDNEEDQRSSNGEGGHSDSEEEKTHLAISRKFEEVIQKNANALLGFEKERLEKDQLIDKLLKKVECLTEGGIQMEEHIRDLERLNKEKERNISSMSEEMQNLRDEAAEKAKDTEAQEKEREQKDQMLIILENTVVVLEMEKETLHRDLQQSENSRKEMEVQMKRLNEDLEGLRKANRRKETNIENLKSENERRTSKIRGLEDALQVLKIEKQMTHENLKQLEECKAELAEKKEELEKLREQNLQRGREILRLEKECCTQKQLEVSGLLKESKTVIAEKPKADGKMNDLMRRKVILEFELAETKEELETREFEKMEALLELVRLQEEPLGQDTKISCLETKVRIFTGDKECQAMKGPVPERKAEEKKASGKTRRLRKPQINCKVLYRRMDSIEEELRRIKGLQRPSAGTKGHSKAPTKPPSIEKPLNREELHQKMRLISAANLQRLEKDAKTVRELYKINAVT